MRQKVKKSVSILPEGEEKIILEIFNFNKDVQMMFKLFFDISTGFRFSKISVGVFRPYL